jgi:dihydroflavonol-4-reductase
MSTAASTIHARTPGELVAVTGATGHVGGNVVRALLAEGRKVRALTLPGDTMPTLDGLDVERVAGSLADRASLVRAFDGAEVVYHLAAHVSVMPGQERTLEALNVEGVRNVVSACLDRRVKRLVHFSSVQALSPFPVDQPIDESRPLCANLDVPPYDRSKARGELEVAAGVARGLDAVVVNPTGIIGPVDFRPSRSGQLFLNLCRGALPATVRLGFDWVDVRDVAAGALAAERLGRTGERYLLSGHWKTLRELALEVEKVTGVAPPRLEVPFGVARAIAPLAARCAALVGSDTMFTPFALQGIGRYRHISCARAASELGYQPRPIGETVAAIVNWFRAAGRLPAATKASAPCAAPTSPLPSRA